MIKQFNKINKTAEEIYEADVLKAREMGSAGEGNLPYFRRHSENGVLLIHGFAAAPNELLPLAYELEKNNNGEIEILEIDTIQINLLMQMLCFDAREQMNSKGKVITLPLGLFSGIAYFSEIGPGINISIESNESIHGELKSEFESVGINKTRHALYLNLYINTDIILPMSKKSIENTVSILVCENIFLGNIPENYIEFNN